VEDADRVAEMIQLLAPHRQRLVLSHPHGLQKQAALQGHPRIRELWGRSIRASRRLATADVPRTCSDDCRHSSVQRQHPCRAGVPRAHLAWDSLAGAEGPFPEIHQWTGTWATATVMRDEQPAGRRCEDPAERTLEAAALGTMVGSCWRPSRLVATALSDPGDSALAQRDHTVRQGRSPPLEPPLPRLSAPKHESRATLR
jgi:hypothetical protein